MSKGSLKRGQPTYTAHGKRHIQALSHALVPEDPSIPQPLSRRVTGVAISRFTRFAWPW